MVENIVHCLEEVGTQLKGLKIQCNGFDLSDIASLCPSLKSLIIQKEAPNPGKTDLVSSFSLANQGFYYFSYQSGPQYEIKAVFAAGTC